jgi:cardiolipin synthase
MNVRQRTTGFSSRLFAEQALSRSAGAPLIGGNAVELLIDARAHFDAWLAAIAGARRHVFLENYIIRDDAIGKAFLDALVERAKAGATCASTTGRASAARSAG